MIRRINEKYKNLIPNSRSTKEQRVVEPDAERVVSTQKRRFRLPAILGASLLGLMSMCVTILFVTAVASVAWNVVMLWQLSGLSVTVVVPGSGEDTALAALAETPTMPSVETQVPPTEITSTPQPTKEPTASPTPTPSPTNTAQPTATSTLTPSPTPTSAPTVIPEPETLLKNGGFEVFVSREADGENAVWRNKYPEEIGADWEVDLSTINQPDQIHFMTSSVAAQVGKDLYQGTGLNYAYEGTSSQVIASQYGFDVILRQTILVESNQKYRFSGTLASYYRGENYVPTVDKIFKQIGIDPTGGSDHLSPNIVWSERTSLDQEWVQLTAEAIAENDIITVFIRIENVEGNVGPLELSLVHLDEFSLEVIK